MRTLVYGGILLVILVFAGCSDSGVVAPIDEPWAVSEIATGEKQSDSDHSLWGFWTIHFDPASLKLEAEPMRNLEMHVDITDMILPPACDNCLEIIFNSFNTDTGILKFGIILRNEFPVTGHDVRGIIYTDDAGHLLMNADDWIGLHDIPGGQNINPFKGFYGLYGESEFGPDETRYENFEVYIPAPPDFESFNFAVDASYPGQCKEPFAITDFTHDTIYEASGYSAIVEVTVSDWQDDVDKVTLVAPEITGESFTQFYPYEDIWRVQITNNTGAPEGDYEGRIIATSISAGELALHDYVTIEITEATAPIVVNVDPGSADAGTSVTDVDIFGANFSGPESEVVMTCDSGPDIVCTNVSFIDTYTIQCDIDIPLDAWVGSYNVEVTDSLGKTGIGEGLFEVLTPWPLVLGIEPDHADGGDSLENVTISGLAFIGPDAQVKLKKDSAPDVEAFNISVVDWETITCDIDLPLVPLGAWDVEVTNGDLKSSIGEELFTIECPEPVITSVDPVQQGANNILFMLTVVGDRFTEGPDLAVKLREGGQADIEASNVTWEDAGTLTCDVFITAGTATAYWDVEVTNGCGVVGLKTDAFRIHSLIWNEPSISLDTGFSTKIRDAADPTLSSYQSNTDFVIQGDLCTGAQGTPGYEYYISTSSTKLTGDTWWHEFDFTGDNVIHVDWTNYVAIAPNEVWLWVRSVDDNGDHSEFHRFTTPLQLSHQIWGDASGFDTGWTKWGLPHASWFLYEHEIAVHDQGTAGQIEDGGVRRNGTTILSQGHDYTLESCDEFAWAPNIDCYAEPQIGETAALGTAIGAQFKHLDAWEFLTASFNAPESASWYIGFYLVDGNSGPLPAYEFRFDNICLFHDP